MDVKSGGKARQQLRLLLLSLTVLLRCRLVLIAMVLRLPHRLQNVLTWTESSGGWDLGEAVYL